MSPEVHSDSFRLCVHDSEMLWTVAAVSDAECDLCCGNAVEQLLVSSPAELFE